MSDKKLDINYNETADFYYDWSAILKLYKSLDIPAEFDFISTEPVNTKWNVYLSERSVGKTTSVLLLGLCMNKLYNTVIQYVRVREDMIKPTIVNELFNTIVEFRDGEYIKKLTDGKYNNVYYHWKKLYYCATDEAGKIIEKSEKPFLQFLSIDRNKYYKSGYNAPLGDILICDEFIETGGGTNNAFVDFCDLTKTVFRDRTCPRIFLLANNLDPYSEWYRELEISQAIQKMSIGDKTTLTTSGGTEIYLTIMKNKASKKRAKHNRLFYGFQNPKLASITGNSTWAFENCQHIYTHTKEDVEFYGGTRFYIENNNQLIEVEIFKDDTYIGANVHRVTHIKYDNCIIYTLNNHRTEPIYRYRIGAGDKVDKFIWSFLYKANRLYFSDNEIGALFNNYISKCKMA